MTTIPIVADLVGALRVSRWIYYCVDDFGQWPGLDGATLARMEERLVRDADVLIAAGEALGDRLARMGRDDVHLLTHGVDLDRWSSCDRAPVPPEVDGLPRPLVVFWGLIDRRLDVRFLEQLSGDLEVGTIVLAGPEQDIDPALDRLPRTVRVPALPYEQLPGLARVASVLVMPYADLPVTRAMQPLKLKEYLATGRPVVVSDLPSTRPWADTLDVAGTPVAFSEAIRLRLATGLPASQCAARSRLATEDWSAKAEAFARWIVPDPIPGPDGGVLA